MTADLLRLRPYQAKALDTIVGHLPYGPYPDGGPQRFAVVLPTGAGKTVLFAHLAKQWRKAEHKRAALPHRVLILVHRDELVTQAVDKLRQVAPGVPVGVVKGPQNDINADVIVASVQTLSRVNRIKQMPPVGLVIVDECHHASSNGYWTVMGYLGCYNDPGRPGAVAVGFTATMARGDGQGLGDVWQEVVFRLDILDLIEQGHLVDVAGRRVTVDGLTLENVMKRGGDYAPTSLSEALMSTDAMRVTVDAYQQYASARSGIVFTPNVESAHAFADEFTGRGIFALAVWGGMDLATRHHTLAEFKAGRVQVLVNCAVLTEGFDAPIASCAVIARPTLSAALYCLDSQTEILTDQGWKGVDDDLADVRPAAYDVSDGSVRWSPMLARVDRPLGADERMFALSSPTADIRVSDQHRMVWRGRNGSWRTTTADELAARKSAYLVPIAGRQKAPGVPLTDDEIRFIGWFMTDGTLNHAVNQITIYQGEHQPWNADIRACLEGCGFKYSVRRSEHRTQYRRTSATLRYTISYGAPRGTDKHLRGWGALSPYLSKYLAPALEDMTRDQLAVLLHAMHLGDGAKQLGYTWTRRSYHIGTGNRVMADRLQSLCVRRGFKCNVAVHTYNDAPLYVLHIKDTAEKWVGGSGDSDRESLREVGARPGERVWCVETDAGTIITRRNGKVAILGNCQMVGRILRPHPGKTDALVLDVAGASEMHQLATLADLSTRRLEVVADGESLTAAVRREREAGNPALADYVVDSYEVDLFRRSEALWLQTKAGVWFTTTKDQLYFLWPGSQPDLYKAGKRPIRGAGGQWIAEDVDFGTAQGWCEQEALADDAANKADGGASLALKNASWRKGRTPASDGQVSMLSRLGVTPREGVTKREASDLISIELASRVLDKAIAGRK